MTYAYDLTIYPAIDEKAEYIVNGQTINGKSLKHDGLYISADKYEDIFQGALLDNDCITFILDKIN